LTRAYHGTLDRGKREVDEAEIERSETGALYIFFLFLCELVDCKYIAIEKTQEWLNKEGIQFQRNMY
jgi:hypothetical protein